MFDIGWTELLVVATVAIIVVGPKDLPRMLRTFGQTVGKVRRMAGEFQSTFNDAVRDVEKQADIDDMRQAVEKAGNFDPLSDIKKSLDPVTNIGSEIKRDIEKSAAADKPKAAVKTAAVAKPTAASKKSAAPKKPATAKKPAAAKKPVAAKKPAATKAAKSAAPKPAAQTAGDGKA